MNWSRKEPRSRAACRKWADEQRELVFAASMRDGGVKELAEATSRTANSLYKLVGRLASRASRVCTTRTERKLMDKSKDHEELIDRYLTGMADEAEVAQLDEMLKTDEELRQAFLAASRLDSYVREQAEQPEMENEVINRPHKFRFGWFTPAAAAGLLIGLFSASIVWAYAIPRGAAITRTSQEVISESFEDAEMKLKPHLPVKANQWFGRVVSVSPDGGVSPVEGSRVGQLNPVPGNRSESVRYVVDLDDYPELAHGHVRSLEVKASFSAPFTEQNPKFRIGFAAFSEGPGNVRQAWIEEREFGERVLQEVVRNYRPKRDELGDWHEVSASLEIPEGSRSVVVSLGIFSLHPDKPVSDFYLDGIQVRLVDTIEPSS